MAPLVMDGTVILGYAEHGGFIHFTGPGIILSKEAHRFVPGMLPSLRIKRDPDYSGQPAVIPTQGAGLTYSCGRFAMQLAGYHQTRTYRRGGYWLPGVGAGIRFVRVQRGGPG